MFVYFNFFPSFVKPKIKTKISKQEKITSNKNEFLSL